MGGEFERRTGDVEIKIDSLMEERERGGQRERERDY